MFEQYAVCKYPKKGKCRNSCFAIGWHRCGLIPTLSVLDNGAAGDELTEYCLECGKAFKDKWFLPINQPRALGGI